MSIPVLVLDWREDLRIARRPSPSLGGSRYYLTKSLPLHEQLGWVVHHGGKNGTRFSVEQTNEYHINKTNWSQDGTARAPHIAYPVHAPRDFRRWAADRGIVVPPTKKGIVVVCNHAWERTWHATRANDAFYGFQMELDGNQDVPDDGQLAAWQFVIDGGLRDSPYNFTTIDQPQMYGHGELGDTKPPWWNDHLFGPWIDYGNATDCPGVLVRRIIDAYRHDHVPIWTAPPNGDAISQQDLIALNDLVVRSYDGYSGAENMALALKEDKARSGTAMVEGGKMLLLTRQAIEERLQSAEPTMSLQEAIALRAILNGSYMSYSGARKMALALIDDGARSGTALVEGGKWITQALRWIDAKIAAMQPGDNP